MYSSFSISGGTVALPLFPSMEETRVDSTGSRFSTLKPVISVTRYCDREAIFAKAKRCRRYRAQRSDTIEQSDGFLFCRLFAFIRQT